MFKIDNKKWGNRTKKIIKTIYLNDVLCKSVKNKTNILKKYIK